MVQDHWSTESTAVLAKTLAHDMRMREQAAGTFALWKGLQTCSLCNTGITHETLHPGNGVFNLSLAVTLGHECFKFELGLCCTDLRPFRNAALNSNLKGIKIL